MKHDAPQLFREWLGRKNWDCEPVNLSGITDPYQAAERKFNITRGCLEVANHCRQPIFLITKNALVTRDLDLLRQMAARRLVAVIIRITSLDQELIRCMEPRTSAPESRLRAVKILSNHGIDVMVNVAPIIAGLTDSEIPEILQRAKEAGAIAANYTVLRLPGAVEPIFLDWLQRHYPMKKSKVVGNIKAMREGQLNESRFFDRMKGTGVLAEHIRSTFKTFSRKYGLQNTLAPLNTEQFNPPRTDSMQRRLFD